MKEKQFILLVVISFVIALGISGYYFYKENIEEKKEEINVSTTVNDNKKDNEENQNIIINPDADEYLKTIKQDKIIMTIFGNSQCIHCKHYKDVYRAVAKKEDIVFYYIEIDTYDLEDFNKVMGIGLKELDYCNNEHKEKLISEGFGTPLTLFTRKGKTVDCIGGYVGEDELLKKITDNGINQKGI